MQDAILIAMLLGAAAGVLTGRLYIRRRDRIAAAKNRSDKNKSKK